MNKSERLAMAIIFISSLIEHDIIKIEFEDGSGSKFNYDTTDQYGNFIDLSKHIEWSILTNPNK